MKVHTNMDHQSLPEAWPMHILLLGGVLIVLLGRGQVEPCVPRKHLLLLRRRPAAIELTLTAGDRRSSCGRPSMVSHVSNVVLGLTHHFYVTNRKPTARAYSQLRGDALNDDDARYGKAVWAWDYIILT